MKMKEGLLKFDEKGLIPAIIQDAKTKQVLTLCYMNHEALERSIETGLVHVFRRSQQKLMMKGQSSNCIQTIKKVFIDCEGKSLLISVGQKKAACHQGYFTCYFRKIDAKGSVSITLRRVFDPEKVYRS